MVMTLCERDPPITGWVLSRRASNAESGSLPWYLHYFRTQCDPKMHCITVVWSGLILPISLRVTSLALTEVMIRLPQCQYIQPEELGWINHINLPKPDNHNKTKPCAYFMGYTEISYLHLNRIMVGVKCFMGYTEISYLHLNKILVGVKCLNDRYDFNWHVVNSIMMLLFLITRNRHGFSIIISDITLISVSSWWNLNVDKATIKTNFHII